MISSPPWRPEKMTDYTNTQEAKLKLTINKGKETNTWRDRERQGQHAHKRQRGRQEERLNLLEDEDPNPKHQEGGTRGEWEVPGWLLVQHREARGKEERDRHTAQTLMY